MPLKPIDGAILLAKYGLRVFPTHGIREDGSCTCGRADCGSAGKHPIGKGWQESATADISAIRKGWGEHPDANIGVACGEASGVLVLDIDGEAGQQSLMALEAEHGALPMTWTVITGSGGQHLYFQWRAGLSNKVGQGKGINPAIRGLDVRTDGGLVIAPPSTHYSGNQYKWVTGQTPATCDLAAMPDWLFDLLSEPKRKGVRVTVSAANTRLHEPGYWVDKYAALALGGNRNETGFQLACQLRDNCLPEASEADCEAAMRDYARRVPQGPKPYTEAEALASWEQALTETPRTPAGETTFALPAQVQLPEDSDGPIELTPTDFTDTGNGRRLVNRFNAGSVLFNIDAGKWLVWTGEYWQTDLNGAMTRLAQDTLEGMYSLIPRVPKHQQQPLLKHIQKSLSSPRLAGMIQLASTVDGISRPGADFDAEPMLLCAGNGIIDLSTGKLLPFEKRYLLSKRADINYDPGAQCPTWLRFLDQVQPDPEIQAYLQRAAGYTLTGDVSEQCLFFCYGRGLNGKTTFIETLSKLLGNYYTKTNADTIMAKRQGGGVPNDVAALCGRRMISASELSRYSRMNEGLVKDLTGGDAVSARFLNKEFFQFHLGAKIWLYGNERPKISGTDDGIWRRIRLIPWQIRVPETKQEAEERGIPYWKDGYLKEKLSRELPGILAWAVRGCISWAKEGLGKPAAVVEASNDYRNEQDVLSDFLESECEVGPGYMCSKGDLWRRYRIWEENAGEKGRYAQRHFLADVTNRPGIRAIRVTGGVRSFAGLRLRPWGNSGISDASDASDTNSSTLLHEDRHAAGVPFFDSSVTSVTNSDEWEV